MGKSRVKEKSKTEDKGNIHGKAGNQCQVENLQRKKETSDNRSSLGSGCQSLRNTGGEVVRPSSVWEYSIWH